MKRIRIPSLLVFALIQTPSLAKEPRASYLPISETPANLDRLPKSQVQLGEIEVTTDLAYSTQAGYRPLRLDLYTPKKFTAPKPLVIYIHGGGWTTGNKRTTANFAEWTEVLASLARRGYVVASIEYRLSGETPFPAAVQDVKSAIKFLRASSQGFGIDPDRVALWGSSAGAHLAALAAVSHGVERLASTDKTNAGMSDAVQAFVGWYGPYELETLFAKNMSRPKSELTPQEAMEIAGAEAFLGVGPTGPKPGIFEEASPIIYLDQSDPRALLIHGTTDTLVPEVQTDIMAKKMRAAGIPVEVLKIKWVGHGWVGTKRPYTESASRQAVEATFAYFDKVLGDLGPAPLSGLETSQK